MNTATLHNRNLGRVLSILAALALVSTLVVRTSQAAFTAQTSNTGNAFSVGHVELTDDDGTTGVMFTVPPTMKPGDVLQECIQVTYLGTITNPLAVRLFTNGLGGTGAVSTPGPAGAAFPLENVLTIAVDEGTAGAFGDDCASFAGPTPIVATETMATFLGRTTRALGAGTWTPTATGETRAYRFTVTLPGATGNDYQSASLTNVSFIWDVVSN